MERNKNAKYRRRFYSLYLDTTVVLVFFVILVLFVWLSMRSMPIREAWGMQKKIAALTPEERKDFKPKFTIRYIKASELTLLNNPEAIAFGYDVSGYAGAYKNNITKRFELESVLSPLKYDVELDSIAYTAGATKNTLNVLLEQKKPTLNLMPLLSADNTSTNLVNNLREQQVYWVIPDAIKDKAMPDIEALMRKYGWLSGNLELVLTVDSSGFVANVVVCSNDFVNTSLMRELKAQFLAIHLGEKNAEKTFSIGVSWHLP